MHIFRNFLIVFSLVPHLSFAINCSISLSQLAEDIRKLDVDDYYSLVESKRESSTVKLTKLKKRGKHGGSQFMVKRIGSNWGSIHRTMGFDPQGDPRWMIVIFGQQAAAFFGFEIVDNRRMWIPDFDELQGAIHTINNHLRKMKYKELNLNFYLQESTSILKYIKNYSFLGMLPIARELGNHYIHDISFHVPTIIMPHEILELSQLKSQYYISFVNFLRDKYKEDHYIKKITDALKKQTATNIDNTAFVITSIINLALKGRLGDSAKLLTTIEGSFTPRLFKKSYYDDMSGDIAMGNHGKGLLFNVNSINIKKNWDEFISNEVDFMPLPKFEKIEQIIENLEEKILNRRSQILKAIYYSTNDS